MQVWCALRSEVSILIPTTIGGTDPLVAEQARWLVQDFDTRVSLDFINYRVFLSNFPISCSIPQALERQCCFGAFLTRDKSSVQ